MEGDTRDRNAEGFNAFCAGYFFNHAAFVKGFLSKMYVDRKEPAGTEWIASQIPQGRFIPFYEGGHMLFYLEAGKFNKALDEFASRL